MPDGPDFLAQPAAQQQFATQPAAGPVIQPAPVQPWVTQPYSYGSF